MSEFSRIVRLDSLGSGARAILREQLEACQRHEAAALDRVRRQFYSVALVEEGPFPARAPGGFYSNDAVMDELSGALATFCPPDKKIIHGMQDAALLPCVVRTAEPAAVG